MQQTVLTHSTRAKRNLIVYTLILISGLSNNCKRELELCRFVDCFNEKNIISSPLVDLEQNFSKVEQEWTEEEMFPIDSGQTRKWAFPTKSLILGWNDSIKPQGMDVYKNNEKIGFLSNKGQGPVGWEWKRIEEIIEPERYRRYRIFEGQIILSKGQYFISREIFLPQGDTIFEVYATSRDGMKYLPLLSLYLNDTLLGEIPIETYKGYKFVRRVKSGKYRIKIGFQNALERHPYEEQEELLLDRIKINSSKDLILISPLNGGNNGSPKGRYKACYYSQPEYKVLYPRDFDPILHETTATRLIANETLESNLELKTGRNIFEIIVFTREKDSSLRILLNNKTISNRRIIPWKWASYFFWADVEEGRHGLKIEWRRQAIGNQLSNNQLLVHALKINGPLSSTFLPLCKIKNEYPIYDRGINKNPFSIIKKIKFGEQTINAIFAPTRSVFEFRLKIPESGILQFGYGILEKNWKTKEERVNFKITLEDSLRKETIFSKYLAASSMDNINVLIEERISLSDFKGKKAKISFITESQQSGATPPINHLNKGSDLAFWFNPLIYKKEENKNGIPKDKPNIILISLDTLRADHLGCYGYRRDTSPNLDTIAQDAVLFINAYSHSPTTLPSHMSMLTSLYPINHGICAVSLRSGLKSAQELDPSISTLSELLRKAKYFTTAFTGGGQVSSYFGFSRGFDYYQEDFSLDSDEAERLFNKAASWINDHRDKKFFLFLHTYQIHNPYNPPHPYNEIYLNKKAQWKEADIIKILAERGLGEYGQLTEEERENLVSLYDGEIKYTDEFFIKRLTTELKRLELYDQTMIIITSDHGEEFYEHKGWEHGHSIYNELIKVPLIIKFPHSKHRGSNVQNVVRTVDIFPTILNIAGVKNKANNYDGKSLLSVLDGKEKKGRTSTGYLFDSPITDIPDKTIKYTLSKICVIIDNNKTIINEDYPSSQEQLDNEFARKTLPPFPLEKIELYDLKKDSLEKNNIATQERRTIRQLWKSISTYYHKAKKIEQISAPVKAALDKQLEEKLESLGYIR